MPSLLRGLLVVSVGLLPAAAPARAATPSSGTISSAAPATSWSGQANGYLLRNATSLTGACDAPYCDAYTLTVEEPGALTNLSVTAASTPATEAKSTFVRIEVDRPNGTTESNNGSSDATTTTLTLGNVVAGVYTVRVLTNKPLTGDGSYQASAALGPPLTFSGPAPSPRMGHGEGGAKDAVVIAVIDSGINPYHWDFLASRMPQHENATSGDDLPLDRPASEWLPGFGADEFASTTRLDLSIEESDETMLTNDQRAADEAQWKRVKASADDERHLVWMPGTKVIGALTYSSSSALLGANDAHGVGVTSSAAGNLHGTCPECLLFFINHGTNAQSEKAIEWAMSQPWIDVITNSYGFHVISHSNFRPNVYNGSDTRKQRAATERGQTVFFSAANGVENGFLVPNTTTYSSQKGPDWMVTVGAVTPGDNTHYDPLTDVVRNEPYGPFVGAGKPVDLAGVGSDYPSAYFSETVAGTGSFGFGGTSNATPVIAGMYGRALYMVRKELHGPSKMQRNGVIAAGSSRPCGDVRPGCEIGDGRLTAAELRTRLLEGTLPSEAGLGAGGQGTDNPTLPKVGEEMLLSEGHGVYRGRVHGKRDPEHQVWNAEQNRILGPILGTERTLPRPAGEREWFIVDSYCRQRNWGSWKGGYYVEGKTALPPDDPSRPIRAGWARACPGGPVTPRAGAQARRSKKSCRKGKVRRRALRSCRRSRS